MKDRLSILDEEEASDPHETTYLVPIIGPLVKWDCLPSKYRALFPKKSKLPKMCRKTKKIQVSKDEFEKVQKGLGSVHDPNITHGIRNGKNPNYLNKLS